MKQREIKAKGFDRKYQKWYYGVPVLDKDGNTWIIETIHHIDGAEFNVYGWLVDPETVRQFTGLHEGGVETGTEIYFGDIMKAPSGNHFEVIWFEDEMRIALRSSNGHIYNFNVPLYTIAGNIHTSPELLTP
jgi:hypothetical protein